MGRFVFKLPDIGEGTAEAEIAQWRVKVGDRVEEDGALVDMMTDKATVELTSPVAGTVVILGGEAGEMVPVGSELVVLETETETAAGAESAPAASPEVAAPPAPQGEGTSPVVADDAPEVVGSSSKVAPPPARPAPERTAPKAPTQAAASASLDRAAALAAPAVRRRATDLGIDLGEVKPGPHGRIRHQDLDAFLAYAPGERASGSGGAGLTERTETEQVKVIGLRRKIAEKMQEAKRRIPHFAYVEEVDVTELEALRQHLNAEHGAARGKLTLLPFLIRALTRVLPRYPQINARFDDDAGVVERSAGVHVGIATQTPSGLIVPVLRHAEARSLWDMAAEISRLAGETRAGRAAVKDLSGSTITVTSLGPLGGIVTTPVINHPEVAIVGVNKMVERPVVKSGQIVVRRMMNLSSSFDHRVVDGYDAAEFIQTVRAMLEHPATLFLDE